MKRRMPPKTEAQWRQVHLRMFKGNLAAMEVNLRKMATSQYLPIELKIMASAALPHISAAYASFNRCVGWPIKKEVEP